ncbi:MAG: hypothetical protein HYZ28_20300 [Myxococcales bacterium]|nr:hypothetical protein [Myxococcales bacterium]
MGKRQRGLGVAVGAWLLSACFEPPQEAVQRLTEVERQGAEMDRALDALEDRLLAGRAKVSHWQELSERHQSVSALACQSQEEHLQQMEALMEKQLKKASRRRPMLARSKEPGGVGGPSPDQR